MIRRRITDVEQKIMHDIGVNLRAILKSKGISQKELSDMTRLSTSAVSDYVNAKTLMAPSILQTIAFALKVKASEINPALQSVDTSEPPSWLISKEEQAFIRKYNKLDNRGKHTVNTVLEMEYNRVTKPHLEVVAAHNDDYSEEQIRLMREDLDEL